MFHRYSCQLAMIRRVELEAQRPLFYMGVVVRKDTYIAQVQCCSLSLLILFMAVTIVDVSDRIIFACLYYYY